MSHSHTLDRQRLICVYNADSGILQELVHTLHKQLRPQSYPCSLCALTFGFVSMRKEWRAFWESLDIEVEFYHRDDFAREFPALGRGGARALELPAILLDEADAEPCVLISNEELDAMANVQELIAQVGSALGVMPADMQTVV